MKTTEHVTSTFRFADVWGWRCTCGAGDAVAKSEPQAKREAAAHQTRETRRRSS